MTFLKNKQFLATAAIVIFTALSSMAKDTPLITGDLGGSTGVNNGSTYQEINLGVNINFTDWLTWRNAGFQRSGSNLKEVTGLDSTLRLILRTKLSNGSAQLFVGPGYRWASNSENNATVGEAGLGVNMGGFGLSGGARYLKYDKARLDKNGNELNSAETSYFVNLSGNTSFGK